MGFLGEFFTTAVHHVKRDASLIGASTWTPNFNASAAAEGKVGQILYFQAGFSLDVYVPYIPAKSGSYIALLRVTNA